MREDEAFHLLLDHAELVEPLLRTYVSEPWIEDLDFSSAQHIPTVFHTEALQGREGDVYFSLRWKSGRPGGLIAAVEHQSTAQAFFPLRAHVYAGLVLQHVVRAKKLEEGSLPLVCSVL